MLIKVAVGVGYVFSVVPREEIVGIRLKPTHKVVFFEGDAYPLYKGETFEDSQKIDKILNRGKYKEIYNAKESPFKIDAVNIFNYK